MALLHSLWQAALLWLLYLGIDRILLQKNTPLDKRNFLFVALSSQVASFLLSFFIYYSAPENNMEEGVLNTIAGKLLPAANNSFISTWIFNLYLLVVTYKIAKAIYTWYHFRQQYKQGLSRPGIDLKLFTELKAHHFGIKRKVKLWLSSTINTPVTFGFFKPVILLPVALVNKISLQQAETLVLHELTHIRTNDYLLNWFLLVAETIFFFNPFIRLFCKKIRLEREKYCDINVMAFNYPAAVYAETLLQAERIKQRVPNFQLAAVQRKKQLLYRIQFFSANKQFRQHRPGRFISSVISLLLLLAVFTAVVYRTNTVISKAAINNLADLYIPATGSMEPGNTIFRNIDMPAVTNNDIDSLAVVVKRQMPVIEKRIKKMQPLIKAMQAKAEEIASQVERNFAMPVATKETDANDRQIIIKEESSGSRSSSVKAYRLRFENGQWVLVPEWMATAKEIARDSFSPKADSTAKRTLSTQ